MIYCDLPDPTCVSVPTMANDRPRRSTTHSTWTFGARSLAGVALATVIVLVRWWRARGPGRGVLAPALGMGLGLSVAIGLAVLRRQPGFDTAVPDALRAASVVALVALPHAFTLDLVRGRLARTGVADLVRTLDEAPTAQGMAAVLGRTLGDPSLAVLVWSPEAAGYLDAAGRPTALPVNDPTRAVTLLARDGQRLGALVHDAALREDPGLLASVSAATATALENDALQAAVRAQLEEVRASRARTVAAGDEQRARGSSATSTTAPSSSWWPWPSRSGRPAGASMRVPNPSSPAPWPRHRSGPRPRSASCASSPAASTPRSWSRRGSRRPSPRWPGVRACP